MLAWFHPVLGSTAAGLYLSGLLTGGVTPCKNHFVWHSCREIREDPVSCRQSMLPATSMGSFNDMEHLCLKAICKSGIELLVFNCVFIG
jgi:hypothetical protein